jgi:hypothetical protein
LSDASHFGIVIISNQNSSIYIPRIDPQNVCPDLRRVYVILSIKDIDLTQTDRYVNDFAVHLFQSTPQDYLSMFFDLLKV